MALTYVLLATLGFISILGPFGTDVYLPALPQMAAAMHTNAQGIQLTLSAFSIGMAVGQLLWGPISDRIGRKPLLVWAPVAMAVSCAASALSNSLPVLLLANALIGISACVGMICGRAMISDLAADRNAAKGFSLMGLVTGLGPVLAPTIGTAVLGVSDWRGIYWFLGALALFNSGLAAFNLRETLNPENRHKGSILSLAMAGFGALKNRNFLIHIQFLWMGFAMLITYIAASPFVLEKIFGFSPVLYTTDFAINGIGMVVMGAASAGLMHKIGPSRQVLIGVVAQIAAMALLVGAAAVQLVTNADKPALWPILLAFFIIPSSLSFTFGAATALALRQVRHIAGTSLAIQGALQFVIGSAGIATVGVAGDKSVVPLAGIWVVACVVLAVSFTAKRRNDALVFAHDHM